MFNIFYKLPIIGGSLLSLILIASHAFAESGGMDGVGGDVVKFKIEGSGGLYRAMAVSEYKVFGKEGTRYSEWEKTIKNEQRETIDPILEELFSNIPLLKLRYQAAKNFLGSIKDGTDVKGQLKDVSDAPGTNFDPTHLPKGMYDGIIDQAVVRMVDHFDFNKSLWDVMSPLSQAIMEIYHERFYFIGLNYHNHENSRNTHLVELMLLGKVLTPEKMTEKLALYGFDGYKSFNALEKSRSMFLNFAHCMKSNNFERSSCDSYWRLIQSTDYSLPEKMRRMRSSVSDTFYSFRKGDFNDLAENINQIITTLSSPDYFMKSETWENELNLSFSNIK